MIRASVSRRGGQTAVLCAALLLCLQHACAGQDKEMIPDTLTRDASFRIAVTRIASFGDSAGPASAHNSFTIGVTSAGNYYVAPTYEPGRVSMFSANGKFLRAFGGHGDGPGEIRHASRVFVTLGDTIRVWDNTRQRMTVFDPSGEFVRLQGLEGSPNYLEMRHGTTFAGLNGIADRALPIVSVLDGDGRRQRGIAGMPRSNLDFRVITVSNEFVYVARSDQYVVERYDHAGQQRGEIRREAPWFRVVNEGYPILLDMLVDDAERVWVLLRYPRPGSQPLKPTYSVGEVRRYNPQDVLNRFAYRIEVLDFEHATVLAANRFEGSLARRFLKPMTLVSSMETPDGLVRIHTWRLRLLAIHD